MDISFIGKPHEWDPRRVYSQTGADWQYRVDFDRLMNPLQIGFFTQQLLEALDFKGAMEELRGLEQRLARKLEIGRAHV